SSSATPTTNTNIGNVTGKKYAAFQFQAGSNYNLGKVGINLRTQGTAGNLTGNINVEVRDDAVRLTDNGASTTNGSATVQLTGTPATGDIGQLVTGSNIPSPAYVQSFDAVAKTINLVTTKGGSTPATATATGVAQVQIWGVPASTARCTMTPIAASTLPSAYSSTYTNFSGGAT